MEHIVQIKKRFDNLSLMNKLIIVVSSNVMMILFIVLVSLKVSSNAYNQQLYKAVSGNLSFSSQTIAGTLKNVETLSSIIISSSTIQNALNRIDTSEDAIIWSNANREISLFISSYQQAYKADGVSAIALYNLHFYNITNFTVVNNADEEVRKDAVNQARLKDGAVAWVTDYSHNLYILARRIRKANNLELSHLGDLLIFVDLDRIVTDANKAVTTYDDCGYILFDQDRLIYTSKGIDPGTAIVFKENTGEAYNIIRHEGHTYFAVRNTIPHYNWTYINFIPFDEIARSTTMTYYLILAMLVAALMMAMTFFKGLTRYILKDFDLLIQKMEFFSSTQLQLSKTGVDCSGRRDEIGRLHQHFDTMARRIQELVRKNYINEILSREARLKALESQINPHFLYNTLETINWRAKALRDQQISSMVESLGSLLRATLSNKKPLVTMEYEMDLARSYMTIQKIRFEDRLIFQTACDEALHSALILPLAIQPLLENAVRYGMEEMTDTCEIGLSVSRHDSLLIVEVSNEGSFFEEDLLGKLKDGTKTAHGFGIGLVNIHQRIQMFFGEEYGLSFKNQGEKAVAVIRVPYRIEE